MPVDGIDESKLYFCNACFCCNSMLMPPSKDSCGINFVSLNESFELSYFCFFDAFQDVKEKAKFAA
jgi:hypothetical protein